MLRHLKGVAACLLISALGVGQQPVVIQTTTRLLQISVIVTDKKGEPVRDLTASDFSITDEGAPQKISFFSKEFGDAPVLALPPLPAGLQSNRRQNSAAIPNSVTAILLDTLNTNILDVNDAKEALLKFLRQLQPGDRVAIYILSDRLRVIHDYTSDTASLVNALNHNKSQYSSSETGSHFEDAATSIQQMDDALNRTNSTLASADQSRRTGMTLKSLQAIANRLAGLPGRKNLIWLSGGFPLFRDADKPHADGSVQFDSFNDEMKRTVEKLNNSAIAIYPVDARGLMGAFDIMPSLDSTVTRPISQASTTGGMNTTLGAMSPGRPANTAPLAGDDRAHSSIVETQGNMIEIADRTGGRAFLNSNDIHASIHRAMDDTRSSYALGFMPASLESDGKYHQLKVTVNRPGVEVRYRAGYYALPPADAKLRTSLLVNAATSPMLSTGLGMIGKMMIAPTTLNHKARVNVMIDPREVSFTADSEGNREASLDMLAVVTSERGEMLSQTSRPLHLLLTPPQYADAMKNGVMFTTDVDAPDKSFRTRVVARDVSSGAVGSLDIPFPSSEHPKFSVRP